MKNLYFFAILITLLSQNSLAQADSVAWVYKYLGDTYSYSKLGDTLIDGDTLSVYSNNVILKEGGDTTFYYKNGQLNFLYANNAQVGDIWHPLNTSYFAYDTCHLNLKVKYIDSVLIAGQYLNRITLCVMSQGYETTFFVSVVEKIGVYDGYGNSMGLLYECMPVNSDGSPVIDVPEPCLLSYYSEKLNYSYTIPDLNACYMGIHQLSAQESKPQLMLYPNPTQNNVNLHIDGFENNAQAVVFDLSGRVVLRLSITQTNTLVDLSMLDAGIYSVQVYANGKNLGNQSLVVR